MSPAEPWTVSGVGLRSGQVAAEAGVNVETLRYYERRGLLAEPRRSPGGHRLYDTSAVTTVRVIKAAQRLGFSLEEVGELLEVGHQHRRRRTRPGDEGLQARARANLAEVEERISDLGTIRDNLTAALDAGCADLIECAGAECCPIPFTTLTRHPSPPARADGVPPLRGARPVRPSPVAVATRAGLAG
jgi:DNA-binding transcriptional MerR regulator